MNRAGLLWILFFLILAICNHVFLCYHSSIHPTYRAATRVLLLPCPDRYQRIGDLTSWFPFSRLGHRSQSGVPNDMAWNNKTNSNSNPTETKKHIEWNKAEIQYIQTPHSDHLSTVKISRVARSSSKERNTNVFGILSCIQRQSNKKKAQYYPSHLLRVPHHN